MTFIAGRGAVADVRTFAQSEFPDNPDDILEDIARRFADSKTWTTSVDELFDWVWNRT